MTTETNHSFNDGDILCEMWGYDMTIYTFYRVMKTTKTQVVLQQLVKETVSSEGAFTPVVVPTKEIDKREEPFRVKAHDTWVKTRHGYAYKWDGKPKTENHLD